MVEQYPHICSYGTQGTPDQWDDVNGGWIPGIPGELIAVECRAIPSGSGKKTRGQDGTRIEYDFDLVFPPQVADIPSGQLVTITDKSGKEMVKGNLLSFHKGTLHKKGAI